MIIRTKKTIKNNKKRGISSKNTLFNDTHMQNKIKKDEILKKASFKKGRC